MGAGQSTEEWVENSLEFSQTTSMMQKVCSSSNVSTNTRQNVDIVFDVDDLVFEGNINIQQFANVELNTYSLTSAGISAKQLADLQNAVENDVQSLQTKANEDFGAIAGAAQEGSSSFKDVSTAISQSVSSSVTNESLSELFASASVDQASTLTFRGKKLRIKSGINIGQSIVLSVIAQQLVQSAVDSVMQTQAVSEVVSTVKTEQENTNTGLSTVIGSLGDAVSRVLQSSQFIFLVIGVVALVGGYIYLKNKGMLPGARGASIQGLTRAPMQQGFLQRPMYNQARPPQLQLQNQQFQQPQFQPQFQQPQFQPQFQQPQFQQQAPPGNFLAAPMNRVSAFGNAAGAAAAAFSPFSQGFASQSAPAGSSPFAQTSGSPFTQKSGSPFAPPALQ